MTLVPAAVLNRFVSQIVADLGAPPHVADCVSTTLVNADLSGHHSHGVRLLPEYATKIAADGTADDFSAEYTIAPAAEPEVTRERSHVVSIDGRGAFGPYVGKRAVNVGSTHVTDHGICLVGIRDATHLGRIGEWAERATREGLLFVAFVNGQGGGHVAPAGSTERKLFTNPIAVGIPTYSALDFPITVDVATSQVAHGKVLERAAAGKTLPEPWTVTETGDAVTDPDAFKNGSGALLPLGRRATGHKGFGLSVAAEFLAAIVGDGVVAGQSADTRGNAAAFLFVDPERFTTQRAIEDRVEAYASFVLPDRSDDASDSETCLPGEPEYERRKERVADGIPLSDADARALAALARELDTPVPDRLTDAPE